MKLDLTPHEARLIEESLTSRLVVVDQLIGLLDSGSAAQKLYETDKVHLEYMKFKIQELSIS